MWLGWGFSTSSACLDNAYIESFWATLKKELVYQTTFTRVRPKSEALVK